MMTQFEICEIISEDFWNFLDLHAFSQINENDKCLHRTFDKTRCYLFY